MLDVYLEGRVKNGLLHLSSGHMVQVSIGGDGLRQIGNSKQLDMEVWIAGVLV